MNKKYIKKIAYHITMFIIILFGPLSIFAQNSGATDLRADSFPDFAKKLAGFINSRLIPFFILLALAYFIMSTVQYIGASEDTKKEDLKKKMYWGIIGLFVMLSVWSLVFVIKNTFGIDTGTGGSFMDLVD